ncbi:hypothetical protein cypCar_00047433 [Cyprinus carpio]|nr:hypothetical protein cypCar_00047433 [Cyprinus carpio]
MFKHLSASSSLSRPLVYGAQFHFLRSRGLSKLSIIRTQKSFVEEQDLQERVEKRENLKQKDKVRSFCYF